MVNFIVVVNFEKLNNYSTLGCQAKKCITIFGDVSSYFVCCDCVLNEIFYITLIF
jgi:hypothetical protein